MSCEIVSLSLECHEVAIESHYPGLLLLKGWFPGRLPLEDLSTIGQVNMEALPLFGGNNKGLKSINQSIN